MHRMIHSEVWLCQIQGRIDFPLEKDEQISRSFTRILVAARAFRVMLVVDTAFARFFGARDLSAY